MTHNGKSETQFDTEGVVIHSMLGHIPVLLHGDARNVLSLGLGGGLTLAAILKHDVESVDAVEIDPAIVEANLQVLLPYNEGSLLDPRANIIVADGRNYLASTSSKYDVVVSEPPEIWVSGVSSLFTREFYSTVRRALREGGLMGQWIPLYELSDEDYRTALNTIHQSFPYVYEFDMEALAE